MSFNLLKQNVRNYYYSLTYMICQNLFYDDSICDQVCDSIYVKLKIFISGSQPLIYNEYLCVFENLRINYI